MSSTSRSIFRSLPQVLEILTSPDVIKSPQVQQCLQLASLQKIIDSNPLDNGSFLVRDAQNHNNAEMTRIRSSDKPFIVIEGLDGSGKTTLTNYLRKKFDMELCVTPPKVFSDIPNLRKFFDSQPESTKRAFYCLGNYMAAQYVQMTDRPIIMDRFWHSTTSYAYGQHIRNGGPVDSLSDDDLTWPSDLFKPNLVIFLELSEEARLSRHLNRKKFTNTPEEQALAADVVFRQNIEKCIKRIRGVPLAVVNVDGGLGQCKKAISDSVLERFSNAFKQVEEREVLS